MNRTVRLWASNPSDLKTLKDVTQSVFGYDTKIVDKGAYIWCNTGPQREDTRVGMTRAHESDAQNPTYRLLAEFNVSGAGLLTLRQDLQVVSWHLPKTRVGTMYSDSGIVFGGRTISEMLESNRVQQQEPVAAIA